MRTGAGEEGGGIDVGLGVGLGVLRCGGERKTGAFNVSLVPGSSLKRLRNDVGKRGIAGRTVEAIEDKSIGPLSSSSSTDRLTT